MKTPLEDALRYSYRLLSYRGRSKKELSERLIRKGFSEDIVIDTIQRLSEQGLLDDRARAEALARGAELKGLGYRGALEYLRKMGIERVEAEDALSGYDEIGAAERFIRKKSKSNKDRRALAGSLRRRGFSPEVIRKTLKEVE